MLRAAIYARYSSDNQREASIEDQIEVCRRYAAQQGFSVEAVFDDRAISGSSTNRPGYKALLAQSRRGAFDIIIVEALDRLTRKLSEIARIHDELQFSRIALHAVNIGAVSTMHIGMLGTIAQIYITDLRDKTRRGLLGRVLQGRAAGGKAVGYEVVEDDRERGGRRINEGEAAIVRRIFTMFANGVSPRAIAHRLNAEQVPGPEGRPWLDTTIRGQKERGTGIINNDLYAGELVWNRCSCVKDPSTGKRLAPPNPTDQWERQPVPELRIVPDELWQAVKRRHASTAFAMGRDDDGNALNRAHRRRYLLSGLLKCGCCGAGFTIIARDRYGCAGRRSKGICDKGRTIARQEVEERILNGIRERLLTADLVAEFARAYQQEINRLASEASAQSSAVQSNLAATQRRIDAILRAVEDGLYQPSMKVRLSELEQEKARLGRLASAPSPPAIAVHPNLAEVYRKRVGDLEALLVDPELRDEAMELIRSMIETIELTPDADGGMAVLLRGDLARILTLCAAAGEEGRTAMAVNDKTPPHGETGFRMSVVAGRGFEPGPSRETAERRKLPQESARTNSACSSDGGTGDQLSLFSRGSDRMTAMSPSSIATERACWTGSVAGRGERCGSARGGCGRKADARAELLRPRSCRHAAA
jgi:DNA invertase Pin-like site-specific DNA recombinase